MPKFDFPRYEKLALLLLKYGSAVSPSMMQGFWVGRLASGAKADELLWLTQASDYLDLTEAPSEALAKKLKRLLQVTLTQMQSEDMDLTVYLPDADKESIDIRTEGLRGFCQGFLEGFSDSGTVQEAQMDADTRELLSILVAFTEACYDDSLSPEDNEQLLEDLIEHAKVSALTLFYQFARPRQLH